MQSTQHIQKANHELLDTFWISQQEQDKAFIEQALQTVTQSIDLPEEALPFSVNVALILHSLNVDQETLIACILADKNLHQSLKSEEISTTFTPDIAELVTSIRWINSYKNCDGERPQTAPTEPEQAERIRGMLLAMVKDVRVVLVKIAWRLHFLRHLDQASRATQHCIAQETMDIFAPLANRLGINQLKWELEDLAFRYIQPTTYKAIAKELSFKRTEREEYIQNFVQSLQDLIQELNIDAKVYGRPKHIFSIYRKMQRKQLDSIDQLYDLRAIRIIVDTVKTCYTLLGEIHSRWKNIPNEFDDYIANSKANGYQSLHTVIYGPNGRTIEIQIRTHDMHVTAELGVAAHWQYKEGASQDSSMESAISSLRHLLDRSDSDTNLLDDFRAEVFPDRVFAITPTGDIINLPKNATPLDFAYAIHTSIGHRCIGAKVNGKMVSLKHQLDNGDQVQILTQKEENPKRSWINPSLGFLQTTKARYSVRHWLKQQDHETNKRDGLSLLEREVNRLGIDLPDIEDLRKKFKLQSKNEFLIALGRGDIGIHQLSNILAPVEPSELSIENRTQSLKDENPSDIQVNGVDNLLVNIANCCKPVPGDKIIGYITLGRGVSIHRQNCPNINPDHLSEEQQSRLVDVSWGKKTRHYLVDLIVTGLDRPGLLRDVANVLASENVNIMDIHSKKAPNSLRSRIELTVQVENTQHLDHVVRKLNQLPSVLDTTR